MKSALILVDIQNDFLPGGELPVRDGNAVIPVANSVSPHFQRVVATQDWHPANHESFAKNHLGHKPGEIIQLHGLEQVLWPAHCVQNTPGADFAKALDMSRVSAIFQKGTDPRLDSYSGFFDNGHQKATGLGEYLKQQGVESVYILGLATDYCVKYTALDARTLGFDVWVIEDGCRGVDLQAGDSRAAIGDLDAAGVHIITSDSIIGAPAAATGS